LSGTPSEKEDEVGRIVVTEFVSLDGVMEAPGGGEPFRHGGWTFEINRGDEGDKFKLDEALSAEALLLGRVTYEGFAAAWPSREGEFADKFNTMPKYVVSSTLEEPEWNNSTVLFGETSDKKPLRLVDSKMVGDGSPSSSTSRRRPRTRPRRDRRSGLRRLAL
jgi:dihydrofolate reductase